MKLVKKIPNLDVRVENYQALAGPLLQSNRGKEQRQHANTEPRAATSLGCGRPAAGVSVGRTEELRPTAGAQRGGGPTGGRQQVSPGEPENWIPAVREKQECESWSWGIGNRRPLFPLLLGREL
jgi:hypothetical protein